MILLISINKEPLHFYEFVKPIVDILKKNKTPHFIKPYSKITNQDLQKASKVIICGTSIKDNDFLNHIEKFSWIKDFKKPVLGICGGAHVIGLVLENKKLKKSKTEIGLKKTTIKNFLGINGKKQVYHLHQKQVLPEIWKHKSKPLYATLFHPEVRNKEVVEGFVET